MSGLADIPLKIADCGSICFFIICRANVGFRLPGVGSSTDMSLLPSSSRSVRTGLTSLFGPKSTCWLSSLFPASVARADGYQLAKPSTCSWRCGFSSAWTFIWSTWVSLWSRFTAGFEQLLSIYCATFYNFCFNSRFSSMITN